MKKIEVLGTGCPKCEKTAQIVKKAIEETGVEAEVVKVTDLNDIVSKGVMLTPAVAVDGEVKISGKVPSQDEVESWLK